MKNVMIALPLALATWIGCAPTDAENTELSVAVRARALHPGEPLLVVATSSRPLRELAGELLGEPLFMVRAERSASTETWLGWTMVGLDDAPGLSELVLDGIDEAGRPVATRHTLHVAEKDFPVEQLKVAGKYVEPPQQVRERLARERERTAAVYRERRPVLVNEPFVRPVPGEPTSVFGTRRVFNGEPRSPHPGLDLRAASGTPVLASGPGVVALAADLYYSGNTVIMDHGGGLFTIYAHLSRIDVAEGQQLDAGAPLGRSGATGRVTGPHLHWGAKIGSRPFDPTALLDPVFFD